MKPDSINFRTFWISWKIHKKLKTVAFINMWLLFLKLKSSIFASAQKTTFAWSDLEQVSSWWIYSKFCVYKISIWRCIMILTFSGLHFLFYKTPMNFQQGLLQPPVEQKWSKRITVHCLAAWSILLKFRYFEKAKLKKSPILFWKH